MVSCSGVNKFLGIIFNTVGKGGVIKQLFDKLKTVMPVEYYQLFGVIVAIAQLDLFVPPPWHLGEMLNSIAHILCGVKTGWMRPLNL